MTDSPAHVRIVEETSVYSDDNIFTGLKVVDFASFIAGPGAATILSDFGADVIKVEPPAGDLWKMGHKIPPQPQSKDPYQWHLANRNKRGIALGDVDTALCWGPGLRWALWEI
jgi:crotonobetainyl-CoA:carnitine CoA-transferase CaiB-like acyl-CoA transferase